VDGEKLLREAIQTILGETTSMFDEWLTPDVMELLIREYAKTSAKLGTLSWEYGPLRPRTWGLFRASEAKLYVNRAKTNGLFKQQVSTILHEIQHWNQYLAVADNAGISPLVTWSRVYDQETRAKGYWQNRFEIDARAFSDAHVEDAMTKISKHYGGKVEGGSLDLAIEELFDEYEDVGLVSRAQIGAALKAHSANSPENMKAAVTTLGDLGIKVR
jgi:hypothetical protein